MQRALPPLLLADTLPRALLMIVAFPALLSSRKARREPLPPDEDVVVLMIMALPAVALALKKVAPPSRLAMVAFASLLVSEKLVPPPAVLIMLAVAALLASA